MSYNGPDRRQGSDFERTVIAFMSRIDEHMTNQTARCDSHAGMIKKHNEAIYGNGRMGINTKIILISVAIAILGADSPMLKKLIGWLK